MDDIREHLPSRSDLFLYECSANSTADKAHIHDYSCEAIRRGYIDKGQQQEMEIALECAAAYYFLGGIIREAATSNVPWAKELTREGHETVANGLKKPPKNRPRSDADQGLIWVLANAWEYFGHHSGTAYDWIEGKETSSPFTRFCDGWIRRIDPDREDTPRRHIYRDVLSRRKRAGTPSA